MGVPAPFGVRPRGAAGHHVDGAAPPPGRRPVARPFGVAPGSLTIRWRGRMHRSGMSLACERLKDSASDNGSGIRSSTDSGPSKDRRPAEKARRGHHSLLVITGRRVPRGRRGPVDRGALAFTSGDSARGVHLRVGAERGSGRRGQVPKGTGGMPRRHQMVGVGGRDRPGGAAQRASIPGCPPETRGTETSQYPEERKSTETPLVAASERGRA
jgi:hypothetical protein